MKDAPGTNKLCCHSSLGWEHTKLRLFSLLQTSEFGQLDSELKSEFAALFDHFMQFLWTLERFRDILTTWVHTPLILTAIPGEQVFISIPDKSLNKNKRFWYSSKEAEKIYNPSGRSLSSISHEDLTVFSCEAGKGVLFFYCSSDRRELGFCMELWECGSRRHSVDTENKVGLDRLKVLHNEAIV